MTATTSHWKIRSARQSDRGLEACGARLGLFPDPDAIARFDGCDGKRVEEDTLEVVPPGREEKMAMEGVEGVQIIVTEAKVVMRSETPGQVRGKCGCQLRR